MDFAAYVLFDELYDKFDSFAKVVQERSLSVRLLGTISAYESQTDLVEILSPTSVDALPCILVDVSLLSEDFKRALASEGALQRLVQFVGSLSLGPTSGKTWLLRAQTYTFMDGVDLKSYEAVVRVTRPYAKAIDF